MSNQDEGGQVSVYWLEKENARLREQVADLDETRVRLLKTQTKQRDENARLREANQFQADALEEADAENARLRDLLREADEFGVNRDWYDRALAALEGSE